MTAENLGCVWHGGDGGAFGRNCASIAGGGRQKRCAGHFTRVEGNGQRGAATEKAYLEEERRLK